VGAQAESYSSETMFLVDSNEQSLRWGIYDLRLGLGNAFSGRPVDASGNPVDAS